METNIWYSNQPAIEIKQVGEALQELHSDKQDFFFSTYLRKPTKIKAIGVLLTN